MPYFKWRTRRTTSNLSIFMVKPASLANTLMDVSFFSQLTT